MANHKIRTIRIPALHISCDENPLLGKNEFYSELRDNLKLCTRAFNYVITQCYTVDRPNLLKIKNSEKFDKFPDNKTFNSYQEINKMFPGKSHMAASVARSARHIYIQHRFNILIGREVLPTQRQYPVPLLHNGINKGLVLYIDDQNGVCAIIKLDHTWRCVLRSDSRYQRQIKALKDAIFNNTYGDSQIWLNNRNIATLGITIKISTNNTTTKTGTFKVSRETNSLLVCVMPNNNTPFIINGDHLKKKHEEILRRKRRLYQDKKFGNSYIKKQINILSKKYNNWNDNYAHQVSKQIVNKAERLKVATLEYDDHKNTYCKDFCWYKFMEYLKYKCENVGIEFKHIENTITEPKNVHTPGVYCFAAINDQGIIERTKLGESTNPESRRRNIETATGQPIIILAINSIASKKARKKKESEYHAMFNDYRLSTVSNNGRKKELGEWFKPEPVIQWLREAGCLGNAGNRSQIEQYVEI